MKTGTLWTNKRRWVSLFLSLSLSLFFPCMVGRSNMACLQRVLNRVRLLRISWIGVPSLTWADWNTRPKNQGTMVAVHGGHDMALLSIRAVRVYGCLTGSLGVV